MHPLRKLPLFAIFTLVVAGLLAPASTSISEAEPASRTTVSINGVSTQVHGHNTYRNYDHLTLFDQGDRTPTNEWGVEVAVSDGVVRQIDDRQVTKGPQLAIPHDGYVLSGHGKSRDWLLDHASVGDHVTLDDHSDAPADDPAPPAEPEPAAPGPVDQGQTLSIWHNRWEGPNLRDYPDNVRSQVNMVVLGIAQSAGNGRVDYAPGNGQSAADHAADIRDFEKSGTQVILGVGGASDTTAITNSTQVDNFVDSVVKLQQQYGFSGVDFDLEPSGSNWNEQSLVSASRQLRARFGDDFTIGVTVGLYGEHTARWLKLARALGDDYDYMAPMLYDFPEAQDSRLTKISVDRVAQLRAGGVPDSKIILGYMTQPHSGYPASPPSVIEAAFRAVKDKHPEIRGSFLWEDGIEHRNGWDSTRRLADLVHR